MDKLLHFKVEASHLEQYRALADSKGTTVPELIRDHIAKRTGMKRDPHLFHGRGGGTKVGGRKAALTNVERHGNDFYHDIGHKGGTAIKTRPSGFAAVPRAQRIAAGRKGGKRSKPRVEA